MANILSQLGSAVKAKIASEVSSINTDVSSLQSDLSAEITRATNAEGANSTAITNLTNGAVATNASDIAAEITRAQAAEAANAASVTALTNGAVATNTADIAAEITRAQAAEAANASDISSESTRAQAAEAQNASDISSESTRAQAAEAQNASDLAAEITRAQAAEAANTAAIVSNDADITTLNTKASSLAADGNSASFSGNVSAADVTVSGNLTVSGTTTTIDTTNLEVKDSIMNISKGASEAVTASNDGGFIVERGSSQNNVGFFWDEGADRFRAVSTTATAATSDIDAADSSMSYVQLQVSDLYLGTDNLGSLSDFTTALA